MRKSSSRLFHDMSAVHWKTFLELCRGGKPNVLMYVGESYGRYLHNTNQDYYGDKPVKLPRPEFYMLYTGDAKHTEEELSLADVYWNGDNSTLELKVKVLYGDDQHSILSQYV